MSIFRRREREKANQKEALSWKLRDAEIGVGQATADMIAKVCPLNSVGRTCETQCVHFKHGGARIVEFLDRAYVHRTDPQCRLWGRS